MTEAYNDALEEQVQKNIWDNLAEEATSMTAGEYATTVADVAGIFDPSPASDTVGMVLSAVRGDWFGAGMSLVGMIPYAGDLGKIPKVAKLAPRTAKALELAILKSDELAKAGRETLQQVMKLDQVAAARKVAADRVRRAMLDARNGKVNCEDCQKLVARDGTRRELQMASPKSRHGKWGNGEPDADGNGTFGFNEAKTLPDGRVVRGIEYKGGAPNFDDYVEGPKYDLWEVTGRVDKDEPALARMMREADPSWEPPEGPFTLHHFEDGRVGYVPDAIHDRTIGGAPHTGGQSMLDNDLF